MFVATFAEFGLQDRALYARYLDAVYLENARSTRDLVFVGRHALPFGGGCVVKSGVCGSANGVDGCVGGRDSVGAECSIGEATGGGGSDGDGAVDGEVFGSSGVDGRCGASGSCGGREASGSGSFCPCADVGFGVVCEGVSERGKHWKKNQRNLQRRARRKREKKVAAMAADWRSGASSSEVDSGVEMSSPKDELRVSLEAKWKAENALKEAEAKRRLELLQSQDVEQLKKLQERKVHSATERAMVAAEKAHATLRATGNVPGVVPKGGYEVGVAPVDGTGFCETLVECTISPDSSASMKEFRECQKENADLKAELAALKLQVKKDKFNRNEAVTMTCDSEGDLSEAREEWIQESLERDHTCEDEREYLYKEGRNEKGELTLGRAGVRVRKMFIPPSDDGEFYM